MSAHDAQAETVLHTIGHSSHSQADFFQLLSMHRIQVLVDVRSQPYSRYADQFNKPMIEQAAKDRGLSYLFLGREMGGRPKDDDYYDAENRVLYWKIAATPGFARGLKRLMNGLAKGLRIALMCGEEDPSRCHRRLLIGRVLRRHGVEVRHIRATGRAVSEEDLARLEGPKVRQLSLLDSDVDGWGQEWVSVDPVKRNFNR